MVARAAVGWGEMMAVTSHCRCRVPVVARADAEPPTAFASVAAAAPLSTPTRRAVRHRPDRMRGLPPQPSRSHPPHQPPRTRLAPWPPPALLNPCTQEKGEVSRPAHPAAASGAHGTHSTSPPPPLSLPRAAAAADAAATAATTATTATATTATATAALPPPLPLPPQRTGATGAGGTATQAPPATIDAPSATPTPGRRPGTRGDGRETRARERGGGGGGGTAATRTTVRHAHPHPSPAFAWRRVPSARSAGTPRRLRSSTTPPRRASSCPPRVRWPQETRASDAGGGGGERWGRRDGQATRRGTGTGRQTLGEGPAGVGARRRPPLPAAPTGRPRRCARPTHGSQWEGGPRPPRPRGRHESRP